MSSDRNQVTHLMVTAYGCAGRLDSPRSLAAACTNAVMDGDLEIVAEASYAFTPHGATVALILAQSHLVVSTWPEHGSVLIDISVCAPREAALRVVRFLADYLRPTSQATREQVVFLLPGLAPASPDSIVGAARQDPTP